MKQALYRAAARWYTSPRIWPIVDILGTSSDPHGAVLVRYVGGPFDGVETYCGAD